VVSAFGWAGCAALKACVPNELDELVVDPNCVKNEVCKHHHEHLHPGIDMTSGLHSSCQAMKHSVVHALLAGAHRRARWIRRLDVSGSETDWWMRSALVPTVSSSTQSS